MAVDLAAHVPRDFTRKKRCERYGLCHIVAAGEPFLRSQCIGSEHRGCLRAEASLGNRLPAIARFISSFVMSAHSPWPCLAVALVLGCSSPLEPAAAPASPAASYGSAAGGAGEGKSAPAASCHDGDLVGCAKACDAGTDHGEACSKLGQVLLAGGWGQRARRDDALARLTLGCKQGSREACSIAARQLGSGPPELRDPARALELAEKACDGGKDPLHCAELGELFAEGVGTSKDVDRAFDLQQKACDAGRESSCFWLGDALQHGRRGPPDVSGAVMRFRASCERGSGDACLRLAQLHRTGRGVPLDVDGAIDLYRKACQKGSAVACTVPPLDSMLPKIAAARADGIEILFARCREGDSDSCAFWEHATLATPERDVVAVAALGKGCAQGSENACSRLGSFYIDGRGVELNTAEGRERLRLGCQLGLSGSCLELARHLRTSAQSDADMAEAIKLYTDDCKAGVTSACNAVGYLSATGQGMPVDGARSRRLFEQGCDDGDPNICDSLAEALEKGWGAPPDPRKALAQYRKACDMAVSISCDSVKRLGGTGH